MEKQSAIQKDRPVKEEKTCLFFFKTAAIKAISSPKSWEEPWKSQLFSQPKISKPLFLLWSRQSPRCFWVMSSTKLLLLGANPATSGKQPATWRLEVRNTSEQPAMWEVTGATAPRRCKMPKLTSSTGPIAISSCSLWKPFTYPGERRPSTRRRSTGSASSNWECDLSLFQYILWLDKTFLGLSILSVSTIFPFNGAFYIKFLQLFQFVYF